MYTVKYKNMRDMGKKDAKTEKKKAHFYIEMKCMVS